MDIYIYIYIFIYLMNASSYEFIHYTKFVSFYFIKNKTMKICFVLHPLKSKQKPSIFLCNLFF